MENLGEQTRNNAENSEPTPWDKMAEVKFAGADKNKAATVESMVENSIDQASMRVNNFITGWQKRRAERQQGQTNDRFEVSQDREEAAREAVAETTATKSEAGRVLDEAIADVQKTEDNIAHNKEVIKELTDSTRIDKYVKSQAMQVGEIIKAGGEVLKSELRKFGAEIIARIPMPKIKFESAADVANSTWNEQQHAASETRREAKYKIQAVEAASAGLAAAKEALRDKFNGIGEKRQDRISNLDKLGSERQSLRENKDLLKNEEAMRDAANEAWETARDKFMGAKESLRLASEAFEGAKRDKAAADAKVEGLKQEIYKQESMIAFQSELGSKDPVRMIENIENQKRGIVAKRQEKIEDLLFMADAGSIDELSDTQRQRIDKVLKRYDDEIAMADKKLETLETYAVARRKKVKGILANPAARASIRGFREEAA